MSDIIKCQEVLLRLAQEKGYLTFDDILNASDTFSLSVVEVDNLSESIQVRGILVYETAPNYSETAEDKELVDYSRTDYETVFKEILELAPQLKQLIDEIKDLPTPRYGEVTQLALQIREGNQFARDRLIKLYMRNVLKSSLTFSKLYELDLEETISSGFAGLISAVDHYDPAGFTAFGPYAGLWMQQMIHRECSPVWIDYYFPAHYREKINRILQKYNQYSAGEEIGSPAFFEVVSRISNEIEYSQKEIIDCLYTVYSQKFGKISIEEIASQELPSEDDNLSPDNDGEPPTISPELIAEPPQLENIFAKERTITINKVLNTLSQRERKVIEMRNGFHSSKPQTLEEVGRQFHVTRERVRQIEAKAMRKLQHPSRKKLLKPFRP